MLERILEPEAMDTPAEAESYDSMDHTQANAAFVTRLFELGASGRMLDIGTGPGHMPPMICDRDPAATIVGVDLAHQMIRAAERNLTRTPHGTRITYRHMDAKELAFSDGEFDAVYSNTILHHIPDPRPFLMEARRVLRPGAVLLVRDLFRPATHELLESLVETHAAGCDDRQRGLFADSLHAAFTPEELRAIADESGLADAKIVIDTDRHMSLQLPAAG
ncbi:MAG: methyltransferase domain-containing protein [Planctomycetota bacterium]|jgi:ubiquinone/menaquinone biosynthesis C-methylase UbiE|nr:methyltransferase domain-containing protein [Planctomycetota bacterium]MDP6761853.1 methyltransferase domain-containing protein [Planctomycetota bacterium]MDP6988899.1 methyltransferase domain-containing protein [Planctomycetota bacterium]